MKSKITFLIWMGLISLTASAQDVDELIESFELDGPKWYFAELGFSAGYGQFNVNNAENPTLGTFTPSLSLGMRTTGKFYLGATAEAQLVNQYSGITSDGNFRGQRITLVSPMFVYLFSFGSLKLNYIFMGNYRLLKDTPSGKSVEYSDPRGLKIAVSFLRMRDLHFGLFFERIWYSKTKLNTAESDFSTRLTSIGIQLGYRI